MFWAQKWNFCTILFCNRRNILTVGRNNDPVKKFAVQGRFDGIGDNRFVAEEFDVFLRNSFATAAGWDNADTNDSTS